MSQASIRVSVVGAFLILAAGAHLADAQTQGRPLDIDAMRTQPQRTKTVVPSYPPGARSGTVVLRVTLDPEGRVSAVSVVRPVEGATEAARAAVAQWEYEPVLLNGEPIWVAMTVRVPCPWSE